jgi:hypothetical protein
VKFWGDSSHCFRDRRCKFQLVFPITSWVAIVWLQRYLFGCVSNYHSIKLETVASVFCVFLCNAHECVSLLSSDQTFLHFSWNSLVMLFSVFSWRMCWHHVPISNAWNTSNILWISTQQMSFLCGQWRVEMVLEDIPVWQGCHYHHHFFDQNTDPSFSTMCVGNRATQGSLTVCSVRRSWMLS